MRLTHQMLRIPEPAAEPPAIARSPAKLTWALLSAGFLALVFAIVFLIALRSGLYDDESQFVASAALLARKGLLPYRDFVYFHTPNLVFVYAWIFGLSNYLLLSARCVEAFAACGMITAVFCYAAGVFANRSRPEQMMASGAAVLLLITNNVFTYTAGKAWNHDIPLLLGVLAFLALRKGIGVGVKLRWLALSGFAGGLAAGCRLPLGTFVFVTAASVLAIARAPRRDRLLGAGVVLLAALVAMTPTFVLAVIALREFFFGNFQFRQLAVIYAQTQDKAPLTTAHLLGSKVALIFKHSVGGGGTLILLLGGVVTAWIAHKRGRTAHGADLRILELLVFYLWLSAAIATPEYQQYYYELLPFLVMLLALQVERAFAERSLPWRYIAAVLVATIGLNWHTFLMLTRIKSLSSLDAVRMHKTGRFISAHTGASSPILTLDPVPVLEGGRAIYPQCATGGFALRIAPLAMELKARNLGFRPDGLPLDIAADPPGAFLRSAGPQNLERAMLDYARSRHWTPLAVPHSEGWLWSDAVTRPQPPAGQVVQSEVAKPR